MIRIKEIVEKHGIEFDEYGYSKNPISLKQLQRIFDAIIDENNANWQQGAIENINAPFSKMQEKLKEMVRDKKV